VKKINIVFFVLLFSLLTVSCSSYSKITMEPGFNSLVFSDSVTMEITDEWIDSGSPELNVKIVNNTEEELRYTEEPHLEVRINGSWYIVPLIEDASWTVTLYTLGAGETQDYIFSLSDYYELESGFTYRLVKNFNNYFSYAEFFVDEL